jgi:hypothetical protein
VQLAEPGDAAVPAALPGQFLVMRLPVNPQVLAMLHALAAAKSGRDIW